MDEFMSSFADTAFDPPKSLPHTPTQILPPSRELPYKVAPWAHQLEGIRRSRERDNFAFFFDAGTGKTLTTINALRYKWLACGKVMPTLVLGPPIVLENWRREFLAHSKLTDGQIFILDGPGTRRLATLTDACRHPGAVVVTNYETLLMDPVFELLRAWSPACIVFDESHRLKDIKAKRTKRAVVLARPARHRFLLTGTPILKDALDLFSQFLILDGGQTFGENFFVFRARYFYDRNAHMPKAKYFPDWRIQQGSVEDINRRIKAASMSAKKSECLDLPPLVRQQIDVALSPLQRRLYDDMKKDLIAYLNDRACVATIALTKSLRLQQIVSGFVAVENSDTGERDSVSIKDNPRAAALEVLLSDLVSAHKVIVWAVFRENYEAIRQVCASLNVRYVEVHGDVAAGQKQKNVDEFNTNPECRVLIGHPGSGGIGINLVSRCEVPTDVSVWYSRSFSLEHDIQAEARNYRGGCESLVKVTRYDLVAPGTIDEVVLKSLASKTEIGEKILANLSAMI
jgi:SNF2 family DNA or RNA helicase